MSSHEPYLKFPNWSRRVATPADSRERVHWGASAASGQLFAFVVADRMGGKHRSSRDVEVHDICICSSCRVAKAILLYRVRVQTTASQAMGNGFSLGPDRVSVEFLIIHLVRTRQVIVRDGLRRSIHCG